MEAHISDPDGPSPRSVSPGIMDMHPDDPRRSGALFISRAVDRVADLAMQLVSERMIPIMGALEDLTTAINEEVDTIAVAAQHIANHSSVRSDGQLTSLAQRIRNSTQNLKDAMAQANASGDTAGTVPGSPTTVPGGQSETSGVDRGATAVSGGGFGGMGASAGTVVGPTDRDLDPNAGRDVGTTESASSDTGSASPSETLLNPDNPTPQAGTPSGPGQEKAAGTTGPETVKP